MKRIKFWAAEVKQNDEGDLFIEFPEMLMQQMGWNEGDTMVWKVLSDGNIFLSKQDDEQYEDVGC